MKQPAPIFPDQSGLHGLDMPGDGLNGDSVMLKILDGSAIVVDFVGFMFGEIGYYHVEGRDVKGVYTLK